MQCQRYLIAVLLVMVGGGRGGGGEAGAGAGVGVGAAAGVGGGYRPVLTNRLQTNTLRTQSTHTWKARTRTPKQEEMHTRTAVGCE
jgi:hypothetical protein